MARIRTIRNFVAPDFLKWYKKLSVGVAFFVAFITNYGFCIGYWC